MKIDYQHNKTLLRVYLYYRFVLGALLFTMFFSGLAAELLGNRHPQLFHWTSLIYAGTSLAIVIVFRVERLQASVTRIYSFLILDLLAILLMVHASGGIESGLGYLFLVSTAIASMFVRMQLGLAFAALTSLFVIGETVYLSHIQVTDNRSVFSSGILGILIFATALAFQYLTNKIRTSDIEAAHQARHAEHLQRLAQMIVARMRTGIIVVDNDTNVELINQSAIQLLGVPPRADYTHQPLESFSNLTDLLHQWQQNQESTLSRHHVVRGGQEVRVNFATLDTGAETRSLLFLEDHRMLAQQAQQLKLASLGRLTASIAHEVRNPLGAISHAAQLLSESPHIDPSDERLTEIIHQHSLRVNQIIENTLVLSRRRNPNPEVIRLADWLPRFVTEYSAGKDAEITLRIESDDIVAKVDPVQLNQVLTNLCDNGIRHSKLNTGRFHVELRAGLSETGDTSYLAVVDDGRGVPTEQVQQIFDPFFTTDDQGSGLGLYICKELCEINQASLHYQLSHDGKSCFRIDFSHHQRIF